MRWKHTERPGDFENVPLFYNYKGLPQMKHDHHVTNMGARLGRFLGRGAKATIPVAQRQRQQANVESVPIQEPKADFLNRLKDVYVESKTETVRVSKGLEQITLFFFLVLICTFLL